MRRVIIYVICALYMAACIADAKSAKRGKPPVLRRQGSAHPPPAAAGKGKGVVDNKGKGDEGKGKGKGKGNGKGLPDASRRLCSTLVRAVKYNPRLLGELVRDTGLDGLLGHAALFGTSTSKLQKIARESCDYMRGNLPTTYGFLADEAAQDGYVRGVEADDDDGEGGKGGPGPVPSKAPRPWDPRSRVGRWQSRVNRVAHWMHVFEQLARKTSSDPTFFPRVVQEMDGRIKARLAGIEEGADVSAFEQTFFVPGQTKSTLKSALGDDFLFVKYASIRAGAVRMYENRAPYDVSASLDLNVYQAMWDDNRRGNTQNTMVGSTLIGRQKPLFAGLGCTQQACPIPAPGTPGPDGFPTPPCSRADNCTCGVGYMNDYLEWNLNFVLYGSIYNDNAVAKLLFPSLYRDPAAFIRVRVESLFVALATNILRVSRRDSPIKILTYEGALRHAKLLADNKDVSDDASLPRTGFPVYACMSPDTLPFGSPAECFAAALLQTAKAGDWLDFLDRAYPANGRDVPSELLFRDN